MNASVVGDANGPATKGGSTMAWELSGTYFEHCPCGMVCPCTTSGLTMPGDTERCTVVFTFNITRGTVDRLDVGGRTVVVVADAPRLMSEGGWKVGMYVDEAASDDQFDALTAVFGGQRGGIWSALAPLVGELLGAERVPIEVVEDGRTHRLRVGDIIDIEVEDWLLPGAEEVAKLTGMVFPAPELTIAKSTRSHVDAFGIRMDSVGTNGHSAPFSWAA
jgi:hypothetical protein